MEAISSTGDLIKIFPTHPKDYAPRRVKLRMHARLIYTSKKGPLENKLLRLLDQQRTEETKIIKKEGSLPAGDPIPVKEARRQLFVLNKEVKKTKREIIFKGGKK